MNIILSRKLSIFMYLRVSLLFKVYIKKASLWLRAVEKRMSQGEEFNMSIRAYSNWTELNLFVDLNETVFVNSNWEMSNFNLVLFITNNLTILLVNIVVLVWLKIKENTLVDRMVLLDCLANISTIGVMFLAFPIRIWGNSYLCLLITFFRGFVLVLNR